jgi:predicted aconitase with swiveling domain
MEMLEATTVEILVMQEAETAISMVVTLLKLLMPAQATAGKVRPRQHLLLQRKVGGEILVLVVGKCSSLGRGK